jgi:hypothetical protein
MSNHGSLQNVIAANANNATPEVGMSATMVGWTDRRPATIIAVSASGKKVTVREDKAIRTDSNGMFDAQSYTFEPDENGIERSYSLRAGGRWVQVGQSAKGGARLAIGARSKYHDYSF